MSTQPVVTRRSLTPKETDQRVGMTIRNLMERHNFGLEPDEKITQGTLAKVLQVERPYISNIIAGKKPLLREYLNPIAKRLKVHPHAIAHPDELPERRVERHPRGAAA